MVSMPSNVQTIQHTITNDFCLRDDLLEEIEELISEKNKCILITGQSFIGKTVLLEQFATQKKGYVFSYFVKEDPYRDKVEYIIKDLCDQMLEILGGDTKDVYDLPFQQAKFLFVNLYVKCCNKATKTKSKYYFIIDGLDKLSDEVYFSLLELIPTGDSNHFHIILSTSNISSKPVGREYIEVKVGRFSRSESRMLFASITADYEKVDKIHTFCNGIPGYIMAYLKSIKKNPDLLNEENLDLYANFDSRVDKLWSELDLNEEQLLLMSLITFSSESFTIEQLSEISAIEHVDSLIAPIYFLELNNQGKLYYPDIYKQRFELKLQDFKDKVSEWLTSYYTKNRDNLKSLLYLSEIYLEEGDYNNLKEILSTKAIIPYIKGLTGTELIRDNFKLMERMSLEKEDWATFLNSIFSENVIYEIVKSPVSIETDIKSLLAIKQYQDALNLASLCTLEEDRCLYLSLICKKLKEDNIDVPQNILDDIKETLYKSNKIKEFSKEIIDKWISISANVFPINTQLAMAIVHWIVKNNNIHSNKEKLMDQLILRLFLKLDDKSASKDMLGSIEDITNQIANDDIKNFLYITTSSQENNYEELISKIDTIEDVSAKIFYINSWLLNNEKNEDILKICTYLLEKYSSNMEYTLSIRDLRIMIHSLNTLTVSELLLDIIIKLDNAAEGTIKSPIKEYIQFKLLLNELKYKNISNDRNETDKLIVYIEEIKEIDIKAYSYSLLLKLINKIPDLKTIFYEDILKAINDTFEEVYIQTALHSDVIEDALAELSTVNINIALGICNNLNTELTRVKAYLKIFSKLIDNNHFETTILSTVRPLISKGHFDYLLHHITKEFHRNNTTLDEDQLLLIEDNVNNIYSSLTKILSLSNTLYLSKDNNQKYKEKLEEIKKLIISIDSIEYKKQIGYIILERISTISLDNSKELYELIFNNGKDLNFIDSRLRKLNFYLVKLLIKMIPDLLNNEQPDFFIKQIISTIQFCDSLHEKAMLYNMLGLKIINNKRIDLLDSFIDMYNNILCSSHLDTTMYLDIFEDAGVLLYLTDKRKYFTLYESLPYQEYKDDSILSVIKYILSKRSSLEEVDFDVLNTTISDNEAFEILDLITQLKMDTKIYYSLKSLIDIVEKSVSRSDHTIRQGTVLDIFNKASTIIESKLPDMRNIKHEGYKISCYSKFAALKRTNIKKGIKNGLPNFDDLYNTINNIHNISDKIFILCTLSVDAYGYDLAFSSKVLSEAEELLTSITNLSDKIDRAEQIIESYYLTDQYQAAEHLLNNIFQIIKLNQDSYDVEKNIEDLIEIAYKINPELAHQLAKGLDSPNQQIEVSRTLKTLDLHLNPQKLMNEKSIESKTIKSVYKRTIESLHNARGISQDNKLVINSVSKVNNIDIETVLYLFDWFIENTIKQNGVAKVSNLTSLFTQTIHNRDFLFETDSSLINSEKVIKGFIQYKELNNEDESHYVFKQGQGQIAKDHIIKWINKNAEHSLFIYDPYFSEKDLDLFTSIKPMQEIYVVTSFDSKNGIPTREDFNTIYLNAWRKICDQTSPKIEFFVLCSENRKNEMHDRYLITDTLGIKYGVSFNGMNSNDFSIEYLNETSAEKVKAEIILNTIFNAKLSVNDISITKVKFQL